MYTSFDFLEWTAPRTINYWFGVPRLPPICVKTKTGNSAGWMFSACRLVIGLMKPLETFHPFGDFSSRQRKLQSREMSAHVDEGLSRGSTVCRPRSMDPHRCERNLYIVFIYSKMCDQISDKFYLNMCRQGHKRYYDDWQIGIEEIS